MKKVRNQYKGLIDEFTSKLKRPLTEKEIKFLKDIELKQKKNDLTKKDNSLSVKSS
jgi:hypothetical protein